MNWMKQFAPAALLAGVALGIGLQAGTAKAQGVLVWSTQHVAVEEQKRMKEEVLKTTPVPLDFLASQEGPFLTRLNAELQAGKGSIGVLGALHGQLQGYGKDLVDLSAIGRGAAINPAFVKLGKLGSSEQKYLPWMQATYVMAAHKKALPFLPAGADINKLTYDQFVAWMRNLTERTGGAKFGFPAGPQGLKHRFFQGYLLPSYADSTVTGFRSAGAEKGWEMMKELWKYTHPSSPSFNFMEEPLVNGQVWVAFDHNARLAEAFNKYPDDFVAFPVPSGPTGRGFMPVLAGVAIPRTAPDRAAAEKVIAYMMRPEVQIATLKATNFFPTIDVKLPNDLPPAARILGAAIQVQSSSPDANPAMLPTGLGNLSGKFNQVYNDAFERIILARQPVRPVLDELAGVLRQIMVDSNAPCWEPDPASAGPCPVK
jgi:multiple sugar transport system substrate-binding protein